MRTIGSKLTAHSASYQRTITNCMCHYHIQFQQITKKDKFGLLQNSNPLNNLNFMIPKLLLLITSSHIILKFRFFFKCRSICKLLQKEFPFFFLLYYVFMFFQFYWSFSSLFCYLKTIMWYFMVCDGKIVIYYSM